MRSPLSLVYFSLLLWSADAAPSDTSDPTAPQPALRFMHRSNRAHLTNPLLANRQVQARELRAPPPNRAKRACPSFLPNGNCACPDGTVYCDSETTCISIYGSDPTNCGGCGYTCGLDFACTSGQCVCIDGYTDCGYGYCVDFQNDDNNCGMCGMSCGTGSDCIGGACVCDRPGYEGQTYCDPSCTDITSDPNNCGACGNGCGFSANCQTSACVCTDPTLASCGGNCVDPTVAYLDDLENCGSCGNVCYDNYACESGTCVCDTSSYTLCPGGACVGASDCSWEGPIGAAYAFDPYNLICLVDGVICNVAVIGGAPGSWSASTTGSNLAIEAFDEPGNYLGFLSAVFPGQYDADTALGYITAGYYDETPAGSTADYDSSIPGYYETDVWTYIPLHKEGLAPTDGYGHPISLTYVNGASGSPEEPVTILLGDDGTLFVTTSPAVAIDSGLSEVLLWLPIGNRR